MNVLQSLVRSLGGGRWVSSVVAPVLGRLDAAMMHRGHQLTPFPTLLLHTTGRRSGDVHESPLWYVRDGDDYVVIATNFGRDEPDWSLNLRADSSCRLLDGSDEFEVLAARVAGDDWDRLFDEFAAFFPPYRGYLDRAGRTVPMWRLGIR